MRREHWLALFILLISCGGKSPYKGITLPEEAFEMAMNFYEKKDYDRAIEGFKKVLFSGEVTSYTDNAQFYLSMSYLKKREYDIAQMEFEFLVEHFPESEFAEESEFHIAEIHLLKSPPYYLDQTDTEKAVVLLKRFIRRHNNTDLRKEAEELLTKAEEKLAKKLLETGKLYLNMGRKNSARVYLKLTEMKYPDTQSAKKARVLLDSLD